MEEAGFPRPSTSDHQKLEEEIWKEVKRKCCHVLTAPPHPQKSREEWETACQSTQETDSIKG